MKTLLALALVLSACSHHSDAKSPSGPTGMVDPTLPSWAPRSCAAYHVAVVEATECMEIDQGTRESIKTKYEAANTSWHDLHDTRQEVIDQISMLCTEDVKFVHEQGAGKCVAAN